MRKMKRKAIQITKKLFNNIGIEISKHYPQRQAIIKAKKHFNNKAIIACEIGTFEGIHAHQMIKTLNIKKLYIIDPYEKYEEYKNDGSFSKVLIAKKKAHKLLEKYSDKIVWVEKYSDDALNDIKEEIDFLYIDGNHYSPFIDNDIKNYFPLVKEGGIISGHDYSEYWKDVMMAVFNLSKQLNKPVSIGHGTDWIFIK